MNLVVERDHPKAVMSVEPVDEAYESLLGGMQALAVHRPAAIENHLDRGRRATQVADRLRSGEFEHQGDLVILLDGNAVDVDVGVHLPTGLLTCLMRSGRGWPDASDASASMERAHTYGDVWAVMRELQERAP